MENKAIPESIEVPMIIGDDNDIQEAEVFFRDQNNELYTYTINTAEEYIKVLFEHNDFNNLSEILQIKDEPYTGPKTFIWNSKLDTDIIKKITQELDLETFSKFLLKITEEFDS